MHLDARSLTVTIDGVPRTADISNCRLVTGELPARKRMSAPPPREYRLKGTAAQDPAQHSLWDLVWSHLHERVDVVLRPAGGLVPTEERPWFAGTLVITELDGDLLGGGAAATPSTRFTFDFDWAFTDRPTRVTTTDDLAALTSW